MKPFSRIFIWTLVFFGLLLGMDQFFLRVPATVAGWREVRTFYLDFRGRLVALPETKGQPTVEKLIDQAQAPVRPTVSRPSGGPGFLYMDGQGTLQFADNLEEVPAAFRSKTQRLKR